MLPLLHDDLRLAVLPHHVDNVALDGDHGDSFRGVNVVPHAHVVPRLIDSYISRNIF